MQYSGPELRLLHKLQHPNIIWGLNSFGDAQKFYLVLELANHSTVVGKMVMSPDVRGFGFGASLG